MEQLNQLNDFETEMDKLNQLHKDVFRLRAEMRMHEMHESIRFLIVLGCICVAWYFR